VPRRALSFDDETLSPTASQPKPPLAVSTDDSTAATSRSRRWAFTWFDRDQADDLAPPEWEDNWMSYLICGWELTEEGKPHWQGYLETKTRTTLRSLKSKGKGWEKCHLEIAAADSDKNVDYCTKCGDQWLEWGTPMMQGKRTDLRALNRALLDGEISYQEILQENPHAIHTYGRTLMQSADLRSRETGRDETTQPPEVHWFWGPPGAGKSYRAWREVWAARDRTGFGVYNRPPDDGRWWDTYGAKTGIGEEIMIIDEFQKMDLRLLLRLIDRYPVDVARRGREPIPFRATMIWITSEHHPTHIYRNELESEESGKQLLRRITNLVHFPYVWRPQADV